MGGYVTMAFIEMYSHLLNGFSLMHSSPFADTAEIIENRNREIELVRAGKEQLICSEHIPKTYAKNNIEKFQQEIQNGINIAKNTSPKGIIAALNGMKSRMNLSGLLKSTNLPFLYIHGLFDNFIPSDMPAKIEMPAISSVLILENSGHMGFIEEKGKTIKGISDFIVQYIIK